MAHDHVPAELSACEVLDETGTTVRLGDVWTERPIVLTFVRHFG